MREVTIDDVEKTLSTQIDEYKEEISVYKINNISLEKDLKSKEEEIQTLRKELDDLNKFNTKNLDNKK